MERAMDLGPAGIDSFWLHLQDYTHIGDVTNGGTIKYSKNIVQSIQQCDI